MKITAAICTYNRFDELARCLESVKDQDLDPSEFEILVVDNSLSPEQSERFRDSLEGFSNLRYVITERSGIGFARNFAANACRTPILAFADDDCIVPPGWLREYLFAFEQLGPTVGVVGGKVEPIWEVPRPSWLSDELLKPLAMVNWGDEICFVEPPRKWLVTANAAYNVAALRLAGGFREHLGRLEHLPFAHEEYAANTAILALGYDLVYWPTSRVGHRVQPRRLTPEWYFTDAFMSIVSYVFMQREEIGSDELQEFIARAAPALMERIKEEPAPDGPKQFFATVQKYRKQGHREISTFLEEKGDPKQRQEFDGNRVIYIVTPSFNADDTIDDTILSVVTQGGNFALRYHVQDGGSTDGTVERLEVWRQRIAERAVPMSCNNVVFTYASGPDDGMYDAIDRGFKSMGIPGQALMSWLNADDIFLQGACATVVKAAIDCPELEWLGAQIAVLADGSLPASYDVGFPTEVIESGICDGSHWQYVQQEGSFWRKALWDKAGGLDLRFSLAGDWDLWRRFARHADFVQATWPTGFFRQRDGQLSALDNGRPYEEEVEQELPFDRRREIVAEMGTRGWWVMTVRRLTYSFDQNRYIINTMEMLDCWVSHHAHKYFFDYDKERKRAAKEAERAAAERAAAESPPAPVSPPPPPRLGLQTKLRRWAKDLYTREVLRNSGLFYADYYLEASPDVRKAGLDPLLHYIRCGSAEGRDPNPYFDTTWYLAAYPDVAASGINPLFHYVRYGRREARDPGPWFSTNGYLEANPDVRQGEMHPLLHFLRFGVVEGREAPRSVIGAT